MANAQRKILLPPEELQDAVVLQPRPQRPRTRAATAPQRPLFAMLLVFIGVAAIVSLVTTYVSTYARIAQCAYHRQALQLTYAQLSRDCVQLKLETDHLSAQPRLAEMAMAQGLAEPDIKRLHCVSITTDPHWAVLARTAPATQTTWIARSGRQLVATLDGAVQRLSRGPGDPAYAR